MDDPTLKTVYVSYTIRWWALALFGIINFTNSMMWITFAPISDLTATFIGGKVGNNTTVNMLSTIWSILYLPGTLLGNYVQKHYGIRASLILGGVLTVLGALIRIGGAAGESHLQGSGIYALFFIGQSLAALGQPIFINNPAVIGSIWFGVSERDIATTIGAMCGPIGNAVGQVSDLTLLFSLFSVNSCIYCETKWFKWKSDRNDEFNGD